MNETHVIQMLGNLDERRNYLLPKDIAEILIKLPKAPVVSPDEIDVGTNIAFLKGELNTEFCIKDGTLYLVERATEMGGLLAYTYLTPLTEITLDYFKTLNPDTDLTPLQTRIQNRRTQYMTVLAEHERLARAAMRKLSPPEVGEAKRFIRPGKPDYRCSQLQYLEHIGVWNDAITRWKTACNNKTSAALVSEPYTELHTPQISKKSSGGARKTLDIQPILTAMLKQDKPKKPRIKSNPTVLETLNAENEIEQDVNVIPSAVEESLHCHMVDRDPSTALGMTTIQQLVPKLLIDKHNKTIVTSLKNKQAAQKSQHAPVSLNHDLER